MWFCADLACEMSVPGVVAVVLPVVFESSFGVVVPFAPVRGVHDPALGLGPYLFLHYSHVWWWCGSCPQVRQRVRPVAWFWVFVVWWWGIGMRAVVCLWGF